MSKATWWYIWWKLDNSSIGQLIACLTELGDINKTRMKFGNSLFLNFGVSLDKYGVPLNEWQLLVHLFVNLKIVLLQYHQPLSEISL
jgi:hypothetical protein